MKHIALLLFSSLISITFVNEASAQRGGGHRGGGGGGGRAGGFHAGGGANRGGGGGVNRPSPQASRPQMQRPTSIPHANRPSPNAQRPQMNRPANMSRPAQMPNRPANANRPSTPNFNAGNRPSNLPNRPNTSLPGIGGNTRPGGNRPNNGGIVNRPGGDRPNIGGGLNRPGGERPNLGGGGGNHPSPGGVGDFLGLDKPVRPGGGTDRPNLPGIGDNRPGAGGGGVQRPTFPGKDGDRPGAGGGGVQRPTFPGKDGDRPGAGGGGVQRPTFPGKDGDRPGAGGGGIQRPNYPDGGGNRPNRPGDRPIINKPINIGNQINTNINRRPSWVNINNNNINVINNRWNNNILRPNCPLHNWGANHPGRIGYWNGWANGVRTGWNAHGYHNWFGGNWWGAHPFACGGWHYYHQMAYFPYNYWWSRPAWPTFATWFTWGATSAAFSQPVYYDYGTGGNVVYQDNSVYIGGEQVASASEFAQSAAALATVDPPSNEQEAEKAEWMPLGTFALSTGEKDKDPSRVLQLAVNKQGIVAGTLFNHETDQAQAIQGKVDKDTQRVAFRIGEKDNMVAETGLYNLTQNEAPLLVHYGNEKRENYLLVRLENKDEEKK